MKQAESVKCMLIVNTVNLIPPCTVSSTKQKEARNYKDKNVFDS